jgi:hypothetical protein
MVSMFIGYKTVQGIRPPARRIRDAIKSAFDDASQMLDREQYTYKDHSVEVINYEGYCDVFVSIVGEN